MHLPPEVWGPVFWATLHIVSLGYADEPTYAEKRAAKEFYNALPYVLPCPVCREHFREVLQAIPVENWLDNRTSLVEWVWMAHNRVNERLGKPQVTKAEFFAAYGEMAKRGRPIPPAPSAAAEADGVAHDAYVRGVGHTVLTLAAVGAIGGLLWVSYK